MDSEKLKILSSHYNDTFNIIQINLKKRDRIFIWLLFILAILLFQIYTPNEAAKLISNFIKTKLEIKETINFEYIQSILWFIILAITIKYFQSVISIERSYNYIHSLEDNISPEYNGKAFIREGKSYLDNYPKYLNWTSLLYTILFPIILAFIITYKIVSEYKQFSYSKTLLVFNTLIYIFIVISLGLYLYGIHYKPKKT